MSDAATAATTAPQEKHRDLVYRLITEADGKISKLDLTEGMMDTRRFPDERKADLARNKVLREDGRLKHDGKFVWLA